MIYHLAIDIGASSGRHILGHLEDGKMVLEEIYRFDNLQIRKNGHDCWDIDNLWKYILEGLKACKAAGKIPATLGIDTWAVDFLLLDADGKPVSDAVAYRDSRNEGMPEETEKIMPFSELYAHTGIQKLTFNTVYQLLALKKEHPEQLRAAEHFLMIPEYFNYLLTGKIMNEYTNATSTALVNAGSCSWDPELLKRFGLPEKIFGRLHMPGEAVGCLTPEVQQTVGFDCRVLLPATHDTGSAFMAVPACDNNAVYISSGTWSLLGVENAEPLTGEESRRANFTNEGGYEHRYRYLKNIMGLWMIQSIRRELNGISYVQDGSEQKRNAHKWSYAELEAAAREAEYFISRVDVNDESFLSPKSMIDAVCVYCRNTQQPEPRTVGEIMQCVYTSLASCYAKMIHSLSALTGKTYTSINIVGGGSKDGYLNELTAKATGLPVFAGPTEGTALGNLMAQWIADGEFENLEHARNAIKNSFTIREV